MEEKKQYRCAYCGAEYDTPLERAKCEMECDMKREQEKERVRKEDLKRERDKRIDECKKAFRDFCDIVNKYRDDYGEYPAVQSYGANYPLNKILRGLFWA